MKTEAKKEQERKFFTVDQLVEYLEENFGSEVMKRSSVYYAIKTGTIPARRIGNKILIPVAWVEGLKF